MKAENPIQAKSYAFGLGYFLKPQIAQMNADGKTKKIICGHLCHLRLNSLSVEQQNCL